VAAAEVFPVAWADWSRIRCRPNTVDRQEYSSAATQTSADAVTVAGDDRAGCRRPV